MRKLLTFLSAVSLLLAVSCATAKHSEKQQKATENALETISTATTNTISPDTTEICSTITETILDKSVEGSWHYRGFIVDCNGKIVVYNDDILRKFSEPYAVSCANIIDTYNSEFSIDNAYEKMLREPNPTTLRSDDGHYVGQSIQLTLDADIQTEVYNYMKENNIIGSFTIIDADGAIKSLVSYPSYDANAEFDEIIKEDHACLNRCLEPETPGSTMKILTSILATIYGFDEYKDPGYLSTVDVANWDVKNCKPYQSSVFRTNRQAFRFSSNCFYASFALDIGADKLRNGLNEVFKYETNIDFGLATIKNSIDLSTNGNLARAGFGQREKVPPLYIGMISNGVVTGEVFKPYIVNNTMDTQTMEILESLSSVEKLNDIPNEYTTDTKNGMLDVAKDLKLSVNDHIIYAKTGTAEVADDDSKKDIHYIVATVSDDKCTIENTETIVFQYTNSPNEYASGDCIHIQEVLNMIYKKGGNS